MYIHLFPCTFYVIRVDEQQSSRLTCEYGVLQGSVLGPLLFTLYMSPAAHVIQSFSVNHMQYADYTYT